MGFINLRLNIQKNAKNLFLLITLIKLLLAFFFPITGDEAYFYRWGQYPAFVYYDHPALTGWWMWLVQHLGHHIFFPRLLQVAVSALIARGLYSLLIENDQNKEKAMLGALLFYSTPFNLISFLISTDTPLMLFVFLSGWMLIRSFKRAETLHFFLSALFLGLAFWSKYLMFFMVWALIAVAFLCLQSLKKALKYIFILGAVGSLFIFSHAYWSSQNCWYGIHFNFFNRGQETHFSFSNILTFTAYQFYLASPWVLIFALRRWKPLSLGAHKMTKALWILYSLPIALLYLPSSTYANLHWAASYIPFLFAAVISLIDCPSEKYIRWNLYFSLAHGALLFGILLLPDQTFQSNKFYGDLIMGRYGDEIEKALSPHQSQYVFGTLGYTTAGLMHYHTKKPYLVFKDIDNNGRNDDQWTDYRQLDGKNLLLISTYQYRPEELVEYKNYFKDVIYETLEIRGARFYIARGHKFHFENYKKGYLTWVRDQYYNFPAFLPQGQCFFMDRYL